MESVDLPPLPFIENKIVANRIESLDADWINIGQHSSIALLIKLSLPFSQCNWN